MRSVFYPDRDMQPAEFSFWTFHNANPRIADLLFATILKAAERGFERYGINAASEVVRWELGPVKKRSEAFTLSNTHRPFYARLFVMNHPDKAFMLQLNEQTTV